MLKHDIALLGYLDNALGFYRFSYYGSNKAYVGVIAQEVQTVKPEAVIRGRDGYLIVLYDQLGLRLQTYEHWIASGAQMPIFPRTAAAMRRA
jgi:regulation of enolase protein 1 (concanavalin A-like superfamily)